MMSRENLLTETEKELRYRGKTWEDVCFIQTSKGSFSIEAFQLIANKTYYTGYGGQEVDGTLVIVGDDWWLERGEYDGSEWWEFKTRPTILHRNENPIVFTSYEEE